MLRRAIRVLSDALHPAPWIADWLQIAFFGLVIIGGTAAVATIKGLAPGVVVGSLILATLLFLAAYAYRDRLDSYETPRFTISFDPNDQLCVQDDYGTQADGTSVLNHRLLRVRIKNQSKITIPWLVRLMTCEPPNGEVLRRQLISIHDRGDPFTEVERYLVGDASDYVDVLYHQTPGRDDGGQYAFATKVMQGRPFAVGSYVIELVGMSTDERVAQVPATFKVEPDSSRRAMLVPHATKSQLRPTKMGDPQ